MIHQGQSLNLPQERQATLDEISPYLSFPQIDTPKRVVSIVPSITDSLITLGFGDRLVGITDYCPEPMNLRNVLKVGGPINLDIEAICALQPDLVIGGIEENAPSDLLQISERGLALWVVFPKTVDDVITFLYQIAEGFQSKRAYQQIRSIETLLSFLRPSADLHSKPTRYFCPIWYQDLGGKDVWMVFDDRTYAASLLSLFGVENCFGKRESCQLSWAAMDGERREYKGDDRYYQILLEDVLKANPDLILLPSEPYPFGQEDSSFLKKKLGGVNAVERDKFLLVDGRLLFWYGTRLGQALQQLPVLLQQG